jgi:MFS family permease
MRWKRRDGVMNAGARRVQRVYLVLLLLHTLAASFIWGINTLFLLDAGLTNTQAFAANAFFTAGLVLFEVPTGVVADLRGRRLSYLLGTLTLALSTLLYLLMWRISAPFWAWHFWDLASRSSRARFRPGSSTRSRHTVTSVILRIAAAPLTNMPGIGVKV